MGRKRIREEWKEEERKMSRAECIRVKWKGREVGGSREAEKRRRLKRKGVERNVGEKREEEEDGRGE